MKEQFWKTKPVRENAALIVLNVLGLAVLCWTFARALGRI